MQGVRELAKPIFQKPEYLKGFSHLPEKEMNVHLWAAEMEKNPVLTEGEAEGEQQSDQTSSPDPALSGSMEHQTSQPMLPP